MADNDLIAREKLFALQQGRSWRQVADHIAAQSGFRFSAGYLYNVRLGRRTASDKLLFALKIKRVRKHDTGLRVRLSESDARAIVEGQAVSAALRQRLARRTS